MNIPSQQKNAGSLRSILILDMSYTLKMFRERQLEQALESRKLGGYFDRVISVHPLAGLFESGNDRFGDPVITELDDTHVFVEGKIGNNSAWRFLPPLNLLLAQLRLVLLLRGMAREVRVDVVRIGDPYYLGLMGWVLSRLLRVPLAIRVCFNYDQFFETTKKAVFPRLFGFRFIEKLIERFVFPRCALVAGANQNNLDYALANGAAQKNGVVFRYGNLIHPIHFIEPSARRSGAHLLREIGVEGDFMATVGRLEKMKQPEQNLLVLKKLHELGHNIKFVFIGDGAMRVELEAMVEEFNLVGNVFFAGNRSQEWIAEVLPEAQLVLSPHMGRGLTEAGLAGAPIVAYDYDWQGEIIRSGETGELVPDLAWEKMAEAVEYFLANPKHARAMGNAVRKRAMEMMDPETLDQYERETYLKLFSDVNRIALQ